MKTYNVNRHGNDKDTLSELWPPGSTNFDLNFQNQ